MTDDILELTYRKPGDEIVFDLYGSPNILRLNKKDIQKIEMMIPVSGGHSFSRLTTTHGNFLVHGYYRDILKQING